MSKLKVYFLLIVIVFSFSACKKDKIVETDTDFKVVANISKDPDDLNPLTFNDLDEGRIVRHLFCELMAMDPNTMELTPFIVKDFPSITKEKVNGQDMTSYTYEIREEATWQDGTTITAEDVHFSLKLIFNPLLTNRYTNYLDFIYGFKADKNNSKKFTIYSNQDYFLAEEMLGQAIFLYPNSVFDADKLLDEYHVNDFIRGKDSDVFVEDINLEQFTTQFTSEAFKTDIEKLKGAGAYTIESWHRGQQITLKKVENWWGNALAKDNNVFTHHPKQLVYNIIKDEASIRTAALNDEFDLMVQMPLNVFEELEKNEAVAANYEFIDANTMKYFAVAFNNKRDGLSNKTIRRALALLVDVDLINKEIYGGKGTRVTGPINPQLPNYNKALKPLDYNVEKAASILKAEGWADTNSDGTLDKVVDGARIELNFKMLLPGKNTRTNRITEIIKNGFSKCNIGLSSRIVDVQGYFNALNARDYDLSLLSITGLVIDDLKESWHSDADWPGGGNRISYYNPEVDAIIEKIRATKDKTQQKALYQQFQTLVYEDQAMVFLISPVEHIMVSKKFKNIIRSPERPYVYEEYLKMK